MSAHPNFNVVAIVNLAYQTHARLLDGVLAYNPQETFFNIVRPYTPSRQ